MDQFREYVEIITAFRVRSKLEAPTETELTEWEDEWKSWSKKRRAQEVDSARTHLIIMKVALK